MRGFSLGTSWKGSAPTLGSEAPQEAFLTITVTWRCLPIYRTSSRAKSRPSIASCQIPHFGKDGGSLRPYPPRKNDPGHQVRLRPKTQLGPGMEA